MHKCGAASWVAYNKNRIFNFYISIIKKKISSNNLKIKTSNVTIIKIETKIEVHKNRFTEKFL
jgi:hypothetical protein